MQCDITDAILNHHNKTGKWMSARTIRDYFGINKKFAEHCLKQVIQGFVEKEKYHETSSF